MPPAPRVCVYNGPNLNLLGTREPAVYGREDLTDLEARCRRTGARLGLDVDVRQTNHEGVLIDWLHEAGAAVAAGEVLGVVLNPGALAHTSVALRDAVVGASVPVVEVHLSNVHAREPFRHHSYLTPVARGVVAGLGTRGYDLALMAFAED